jgi:hypothetical protein
MSDIISDIESELRSLGRELAYPATPELAPVVAARLATSRPRRRPRVGRTVAIAAGALILAAASAFAAEPQIRHAVLEWLGLRSVRIERVPSLPNLPAGPVGQNLGLGRHTTLSAARSRVGFRVFVPPGARYEVYVAASPPGGQVAFAYPSGPGLPRAPGTATGMLITEFRGRQPREYVGKSLGPGTSAEFLNLGAEPAIWIAGKPHVLAFVDSHGEVRAETLRLSGNTLVWRHRGVLIRLEASISKKAALRIAMSLR